jgi:hypothetical protein
MNLFCFLHFDSFRWRNLCGHPFGSNKQDVKLKTEIFKGENSYNFIPPGAAEILQLQVIVSPRRNKSHKCRLLKYI